MHNSDIRPVIRTNSIYDTSHARHIGRDWLVVSDLSYKGREQIQCVPDTRLPDIRSRSVYQLVLDRIMRQVGVALHVHLLQDSGPVGTDGLYAQR